MPSITIGFVNYNSEKYIHYFLDSIFSQTYQDFEVWCFDNASTDKSLQIIRTHYPKVQIIQNPENIGLTKAHNYILNQTTSPFYLYTNFDIVLDKNFLQELMETMEEDPQIGSAGGKVLRWTFPEIPNPTEALIDSLGIEIYKTHRFKDKYHGKINSPEIIPKCIEVFGVSGCCTLFRRQALEEIAHGQGEYFDEMFFLYKEDIDLAYRLRWAGWKAITNPNAVVYHDRTVKGSANFLHSVIIDRKQRALSLKEWSFFNHHLVLWKNFSWEYSWKVKLATILYELLTIPFVLIFEPFLLKQYRKLWKLRKKIRITPKKISPSLLEKWML